MVFSELPLPVPGRPDVVEPPFTVPPPAADPFTFAAVVAVVVALVCPARFVPAPVPPPVVPSVLVGDGCRLKTTFSNY
jgi:hypothetical protein